MDRRTAKREACWRAASMVRTALEAADLGERYPDDTDRAKVESALAELLDELERRGWK